MRPLVIHTETGLPPRRLEDLIVIDGPPPERDALIAAGQALTWRSTFTTGSLTAIPLSGASALIVAFTREPGQECWDDRFARGFAHRLAGELTIATSPRAGWGMPPGTTPPRTPTCSPPPSTDSPGCSAT
jgi:hypothetical protein